MPFQLILLDKCTGARELVRALGCSSADGISTRTTKLSRILQRMLYCLWSYLRSMKLNVPAQSKILFFYWLDLLLGSNPNTPPWWGNSSCVIILKVLASICAYTYMLCLMFYVTRACFLPWVLKIFLLNSSASLCTYAVAAKGFFLIKCQFFCMTFVYYYYDLLPPMSYPLTHFWSFSFFAPLQLLAFICVLYVIFFF